MGATMHSRVAPIVASMLAFLALSGCVGGDDGPSSDAISVDDGGNPGGMGPYTFTAKVTSDDGNYTWDMGDHFTVLYGKTVTHTYDFKDSAADSRGNPGNLTVTLRTVQGGAAQVDTIPLRLGTGLNQKPTFVLDAQTNWAVVGETVKFSAARSFDPDADPLRYSWSCLRIEDITRKPVHGHPAVGSPYATPPAGSVTSYLANFTLPAATTTIAGDLCETLGTGSRPSKSAATIEGSFQRTGKYSIFLLGSDGPHPTVSGAFDLFVTPASERPTEWQVHSFNRTLSLGAGGQLQGTCDAAPPPAGPQSCDQFSGTFTLDLQGVVGWVNVTYDAGAGGVANKVAWDLKRGESLVAQGGALPTESQELKATQLAAGTYTLTAKLTQGANSLVRMDVAVQLNMDPYTVY